MKQNARKFLSLLMVFAMLCGMIPAAMAKTYTVDPSDIDWEHSDKCDETKSGKHDPVFRSSKSGYEIWYCDECGEKGEIEHDWQYKYDDKNYHEVWCANPECDYYEEDYEKHTFDKNGDCIYCEYEDSDYSDSDIVVEATVYNTSDGYYLDEKDDEGGDSIEDQIFDAISDLSSKYEYDFEYLKFTSVTAAKKGELDAVRSTKYYYSDCYYDYGKSDYRLNEVSFLPEEDFEGEVAFDFTAYFFVDYDKDYSYSQNEKNMDYVDGTLVFNVTAEGAGQGIGILYTAEDGDEVELDEDDFVDFWEATYSKGTLNYVKFNKVSAGTLYDNYEGGSKKWTDVEGEKCYYDPSSKQLGLDDLTYVPGKNTVSATISFTASGTNNSKKTTTLSGTITVLYMDDDIDPIKYELKGETITLDAADFTAQYKDVMNVKNPGTLQIMFLDTPDNGDLYVNYSVSKTGKVSGTKLTDTNIGSYLFSTSTTASRSIKNVTYVPDSSGKGDEVTFACYSGNQLKYVSTVVFDGVKLEPVVVELKCTTTGGTFSAADFFSKTNNSLLLASYISFGTPSSGTLYKNYGTANSSKVTYADKFGSYASSGVYNLNSVAFIPASTGSAEIPFTAPLITGGTVTGTVKITVTAAFNDVPAGSYYYNAVQWAVSNGVTTGTTANTFSPSKTCTRAEVVTFLWRAKGCPEPKSTTNPFTDISATNSSVAYAYKAILWAVEQGITTGASATTFNPNGTCTSEQVITFLYRANGQPYGAASGVEYYSKAVQWANAKNLLSGTATPFKVGNYASRADIVTYMYRDAT